MTEIRPWNSEQRIFGKDIHPWNSDTSNDTHLMGQNPPPSEKNRPVWEGVSPFDLALGLSVDFNLESSLKFRLSEQTASGLDHEPEEELVIPALDSLSELSDTDSFSHSDIPSSSSAVSSSTADWNSLTAAERNKRKSHARPKASYVEVEYDANGLPHSIPGWIGPQPSQDTPFVFGPAQPVHVTDRGMGDRTYTHEEVDKVTGMKGFKYIPWLGIFSVAIIDSRCRCIALLGGTPNDIEKWAKVAEAALVALQDRLPRVKLPEGKLHHRRAQEPFAAIGRGLSHGGGQREPGFITSRFLVAASSHISQSGISTVLHVGTEARSPVSRRQVRIPGSDAKLEVEFRTKPLRCMYLQFGPRAITCPHLDFANLSWGWCSITALGWFDADLGGHLILWDLKLVIRFPAGSTVFIPSAIIRHSNIPIREHEFRSSFTQYTAGGLFRWMRNGFRSNEDFEAQASKAEKAAREAEASTRWEEGMDMFSVIDDMYMTCQRISCPFESSGLTMCERAVYRR
ncbi:hypothetical protein C8R45DRAFT_1084343 [Mycena sanguinolenta]|nr:hypothetical protein C8R45DRAFT_1084343 [Mycena sanguinolenta]